LDEIGKNLGDKMMEDAKFEIIILDGDVSPEKYVAAVWSTVHLS